MGTRVLILPVLSGLRYWLSSPAFSFPLAVWLCLVSFGISLYRTSPGQGFAGGFIYGFLIWFVSTWWIKISLNYVVQLPSWQAWGWTIAFCAFYALPYALFGYLAGKFRLLETNRGVWLAATLLVVLRT